MSRSKPSSRSEKPFFLTIFLLIYLNFNGLIQNAALAQKIKEGWEVHSYTNIGLKMEIPKWKSDIEDQRNMWFDFGYPLVANPAADVQYRLVVSIYKLTGKQYQGFFPKGGTNTTGWSTTEHLQTSAMTNDFWIYIRRDICSTNGFSYTCTGRVKRIQNQKLEYLNRFGGNDETVAAEVCALLILSKCFPQITRPNLDRVNISLPAGLWSRASGFLRLKRPG